MGILVPCSPMLFLLCEFVFFGIPLYLSLLLPAPPPFLPFLFYLIFHLHTARHADTSANMIVREQARFQRDKIKRFSGEVLGYVTPWNSHGYDVAKWFNYKMKLVSPVWLQLRPNPLDVTGLHDVDAGECRC